MQPVFVLSMKYMFLSLMQCKVSLFLNMCETESVHFCLQLELGLFPFDRMSDAAECKAGQIMGIELLGFYDHKCRRLLISCHNKDIAFLSPSHNLYW